LFTKPDAPTDYIQRNYYRHTNTYFCPCHNEEVIWIDLIPHCSITNDELKTIKQ